MLANCTASRIPLQVNLDTNEECTTTHASR